MIKVTPENSPECYVSVEKLLKPFCDAFDKIIVELLVGRKKILKENDNED